MRRVVMVGMVVAGVSQAHAGTGGSGHYELADKRALELTDPNGNVHRQCTSKAAVDWILDRYSSLDITLANTLSVNGASWTLLRKDAHSNNGQDMQVPEGVTLTLVFWHDDAKAEGWLIYAKRDRQGRELCELAREMTGTFTP